MQIANPIYDVVFKYLMDDNHIAKLMLSKIIGEEIIELNYHPLERKVDLERRSITVYRIDFNARIKTKENTYKQVLIEIQKAKYSSDILRFRKYLGEQYINENNTIIVEKEGIQKREAIPIITIYFLGYQLSKPPIPVIKVNRQYLDMATGEKITEKNEFIESLTHDSFVIQIPHLKRKRRNELETLLSVFDQTNKTEKDHHLLDINEEDFPEQFRVIIRRLQRAISEPKVRQTMDIEDEILEELENKERAIEKKELIIKEKDKALKEEDKTIEENKNALKEKDKIIENLMKKVNGND